MQTTPSFVQDLGIKTGIIELPTNAENVTLGRARVALTLNAIHAVLIGSSTPSVTFTVRWSTDRSAVGTEAIPGGTVLTNTTTGISPALTNTSIPAGAWVWIRTTAKSGTVQEMTVQLDVTGVF